MLLNEFQRQQVEIDQLERKVTEQHQHRESLEERLAKVEAALA